MEVFCIQSIVRSLPILDSLFRLRQLVRWSGEKLSFLLAVSSVLKLQCEKSLKKRKGNDAKKIGLQHADSELSLSRLQTLSFVAFTDVPPFHSARHRQHWKLSRLFTALRAPSSFHSALSKLQTASCACSQRLRLRSIRAVDDSYTGSPRLRDHLSCRQLLHYTSRAFEEQFSAARSSELETIRTPHKKSSAGLYEHPRCSRVATEEEQSSPAR